MPTNFVQPGDVINLTAPSGGVVAGTPELIGAMFTIPMISADEGDEYEAATSGVWTLAKTSAQAWTEGQKIYWDNSNSRCDSDGTVGMLIGVAAAVAANPSSTGRVRLNGVAPSALEGPQTSIVTLTDSTGLSGSHDDTLAATAALVTLTDSTGLSGTHDDTLAATAALVTLTDSTGDSGTHDDTLADGLTTTAFVADNGGATADGTVEAMTGLGESLVLTNLEDGSANNTLENIPDTSTGDRSGEIERNFDKIGDEVNTLITLTGALANNIQECVDKIQTITTDLGVQNQNDSDMAQKIIEIVAQLAVTNQNVSDVGQKVIEVVAQLAVTNQNVSDVGQKVIEIITVLDTAGITL